ncbi:MAG TPA: hypothetical protein VHM00_15530 [Caldimonas sp.]|jgi:hypothetical protein|nr:hypothetical protein [Caldimonas sp.]HEX2542482.1 hypothetical protein [Caldimonas sp.]
MSTSTNTAGPAPISVLHTLHRILVVNLLERLSKPRVGLETLKVARRVLVDNRQVLPFGTSRRDRMALQTLHREYCAGLAAAMKSQLVSATTLAEARAWLTVNGVTAEQMGGWDLEGASEAIKRMPDLPFLPH